MKVNDNRPEPLPLSEAQQEILQPHIMRFKKYTMSERFQRDQDERNKQITFFQQEFPRRLTELAESDVVDLVSHLWSTQMWGNKSHYAQKIVSTNSIEKLNRELKRLWDTSLPVASRYDEFRRNVLYLGPAAVTEIMCNLEPERCGIWNEIARVALKILSCEDQVDPTKYQITGPEYKELNRLLTAIALEIENSGLPHVDLLMVDYFLYEVAEAEDAEVPEKGTTVRKPAAVTGTHDEIRDMIAAIGTMLGFDTEMECPIAHGARVDVLWRVRIGNLGMVTYVFEVQCNGSIDSLVLNLQRAKNSPTVQKVIAVSDDEQLRTIEREVEGLHSEFRNALSFWPISEVQQVSENLQVAMAIINKLGLAPGKP